MNVAQSNPPTPTPAPPATSGVRNQISVGASGPLHGPIHGPTQPGLPSGQLALCPYCGHRQSGRVQCERCKGLFEPLSRQATQNMMGPWAIRDEQNPHRPGCSFDKLKDLIAKGRIGRETIIRGPSTRQFWTLACNTQGVAVLLGECHACHVRTAPDEYMCKSCGAALMWAGDRQYLGLAPVKLLPGQATPGEVASSGMAGAVLRSQTPVAPAAPTGPAPAQAAPTDQGEASAPPGDALVDTSEAALLPGKPERGPEPARRATSPLKIIGFTMLAAGVLGAAIVTALIVAPDKAPEAAPTQAIADQP